MKGQAIIAEARPMTETTIRARIDTDTKQRAEAALKGMGLNMSDAIRLLMVRIADEQRMPFEVRVPNAASRAAMAELDAGGGERFDSPEAMFRGLGL
jgi:DNA-damage-inducible protein J